MNAVGGLIVWQGVVSGEVGRVFFRQRKGNTMKKMLNGLFATVAACGLLLGSGASAADVKERVLRIAYANGEGKPQHEGAKKFAELVSAKSGGKMVVKLFPNATLGKDIAVLSSLQGGTIDMAIMYTSLLVGNSKDAGLVQLPFLFDNDKEVFGVLDGRVGQKIHASLEPKGVIGLGYYGFGYVNMISNKHPIKTIDDFKGQKLRVTETPINIEFINVLGGNAVPVPYAELYTAFEQRIVDGGAQPLINLQFAKFFEVQKYLSLTRHGYEPQSVLMSKKTWDKLSADEKKVVKDAFEESKGFQRKLASDLDEQCLAFLKTKMTINELDPAEIAKIREKVKPMTEKFAKEYNEALAKELFADIAKVRAGK